MAKVKSTKSEEDLRRHFRFPRTSLESVPSENSPKILQGWSESGLGLERPEDTIVSLDEGSEDSSYFDPF